MPAWPLLVVVRRVEQGDPEVLAGLEVDLLAEQVEDDHQGPLRDLRLLLDPRLHVVNVPGFKRRGFPPAWTSPVGPGRTDSLPGRYGSEDMSTRDEDGREDEDWFDDQEEWQDEPTREQAGRRGDGFQLPPPGSPERRRLVLVAVLAGLVLLVIIAAVLASGGDDDEAEPTAPTTQATDTAPATTTTGAGAGGQAALVPAGEPLTQGDSGARVRRLQRALNQLGYDVGQPDGEYGPGTAQAVRSFQGDAGLDADGVAGQETIQAINQALREQGG